MTKEQHNEQEPPRPDSVPKEAEWIAKHQQWQLGERDANGKDIGTWRAWWGTTGHLCYVGVWDGDRETYTRYHPDGTYSKKSVDVNGVEVGPVFLQKSKNPTTELALTDDLYKNPGVFRIDCERVEKGIGFNWRYYNDEGVRVDLEGDPLMTDDELKATLKGHTPPKDLLALLEFQRLWGVEQFANGFAIYEEDDSLFATWSKDEKFLASLLPFASANGMGSIYAFWIGEQKDLEKAPIVVFGDEGGEFVVAENIRGLLEILSADIEASVDHEGVSFYGEDVEPSYHVKHFRKWLKDNYGIARLKNPTKRVKDTHAKLGQPFTEWVAKFTAKKAG